MTFWGIAVGQSETFWLGANRDHQPNLSHASLGTSSSQGLEEWYLVRGDRAPVCYQSCPCIQRSILRPSPPPLMLAKRPPGAMENSSVLR